jgi:valyl-tRNA synthetase
VLADPEKGSGIAMICTFGDTTDVVWWRELDLPLRVVIGRDGRFHSDVPPWLDDEGADPYRELGGQTVREARRRVVDRLATAGALIGEPRAVEHDVKFYEKGDRPLEIVTSRQWYIANGARDASRRDGLLAAGRLLTWHPEFMRVRYEHWVDGLTTDWLISRQRYLGVPFPVWYPLADDGTVQWDAPIPATEDALPVDPQSEPPPGYDESTRGVAGGFVGDPDVMDTWATSSLTPQIVCGWEDDADLFTRTFPMDLRPQGPEIIRTWLFATMLRGLLEHGARPWEHTTINGWILDPDRKKMSKSKGNVVTPEALVDEHGADGLRYWACSAGPGVDTAPDGAQMRVGRRLAIKLLNASKFVLGIAGDGLAPSHVSEPLDRAMLTVLAGVVAEATAAFEAYEYHRALEVTESFFWRFCDDYVELVKMRAYADGDGSESARAAVTAALSTVQRLFAPIVPFVAEEVWSWWHPGSVHRAPWPKPDELAVDAGAPAVFDTAAMVIGAIRRAKTEARLSLRAPVARVTVRGAAATIDAARDARDDLVAAGAVETIEFVASDGDLAVDVVLAAP